VFLTLSLRVETFYLKTNVHAKQSHTATELSVEEVTERAQAIIDGHTDRYIDRQGDRQTDRERK